MPTTLVTPPVAVDVASVVRAENEPEPLDNVQVLTAVQVYRTPVVPEVKYHISPDFAEHFAGKVGPEITWAAGPP
jgi:hypothetical protein